MSYTIHNIAIILKATATINNNTLIEQLLIDSRKITFPTASLFFALHSKVKNGHSFINEVYERGVRNFVIDEDIDSTPFTNANFLKVPNTLVALQALATHHRNEFNQLQVIGITGSNGKTIVKEWLNQLLQTDFNIVRSPRSYNSQIGVPLSVWQINSTNTLGIFEAGISTANEMDTLEKIIKPTIGILTNIGGAHNEGFEDDTHKFLEKIK
ncbi:MAG TPA: Mur ligase family protein [Chitinophagaceae bacterium]|nr:Mur ligase family protein [Chitinophagaceae bacterium]